MIVWFNLRLEKSVVICKIYLQLLIARSHKKKMQLGCSHRFKNIDGKKTNRTSYYGFVYLW